MFIRPNMGAIIASLIVSFPLAAVAQYSTSTTKSIVAVKDAIEQKHVDIRQASPDALYGGAERVDINFQDVSQSRDGTIKSQTARIYSNSVSGNKGNFNATCTLTLFSKGRYTVGTNPKEPVLRFTGDVIGQLPAIAPGRDATVVLNNIPVSHIETTCLNKGN